MKKTFTILLLGLLLFNLGGYYLLFIGLRIKADRDMEERLDAGKYNPGQSIILKVPVYLPYQPDMKEYQPVMNGELVFEGKHYNAVMRKVYRDTVYTVYTLNTYKNRLYRKLNDLTAMFTNVPRSHSKDSHIWDNLLREYLPLTAFASLQGSAESRRIIAPHVSSPLPFMTRAVPAPPPRARG